MGHPVEQDVNNPDFSSFSRCALKANPVRESEDRTCFFNLLGLGRRFFHKHGVTIYKKTQYVDAKERLSCLMKLN